MKKSDITVGAVLIEKQPSKHTTKLQEIVVKSIHVGFDFSKHRAYTYYVCMTQYNSYYPATNGGWLDGLMGTYNLSQLKKEYTIKPITL